VTEEQEKAVVSRFKILVALSLIVMLMVSVNFWRSIIISQSMREIASVAMQNTDSVAAVKANQDLYRQQYLDYIKDMIDAMNKLQEDNPRLKVPKAPVPRTLKLNGVTEQDLRRLPQPAPAPSPIVKTQTKTVIRYRKPKSTPKPKTPLDWFKKTR